MMTAPIPNLMTLQKFPGPTLSGNQYAMASSMVQSRKSTSEPTGTIRFCGPLLIPQPARFAGLLNPLQTDSVLTTLAFSKTLRGELYTNGLIGIRNGDGQQ